METQEYLKIVHLIGRLKTTLRHNFDPDGRRESVAEHAWRVAAMALFLQDEFPEADMNRVAMMGLVHDLGEVFTGDIPVFRKTDEDRKHEDSVIMDWCASLEEPYRTQLSGLFREMEERTTLESRIFKALDSMEAVISHNEADLSTWEDHEYSLQLTHGYKHVSFSPWMQELRDLVKAESLHKIGEETDGTV